MDLPMSQLDQALVSLADLGVHPVGVTVDGALIALRLPAAEQAALVMDEPRREQIVALLRSCGFLHITLALDETIPIVE